MRVLAKHKSSLHGQRVLDAPQLKHTIQSDLSRLIEVHTEKGKPETITTGVGIARLLSPLLNSVACACEMLHVTLREALRHDAYMWF